jgi:ADP-heptose:LPS heptosyltransferase
VQRFLVIQTAFLGDVILATPVISDLKRLYPDARIDVLVRKGNEGLLSGNPHIHRVLIWNKKEGKYKSLLTLLSTIRKTNYDEVIGIQRFFNAGLLTGFSKATSRVGFSNSSLSFLLTKKITHEFGNGKHEVERNLQLIAHHPGAMKLRRPELFPSDTDKTAIAALQTDSYYCIAPSSVWYTKQLPLEKWIELCNQLPHDTTIYLLGGPDDKELCERIKAASSHPKIELLAGKLSLLQSALLMQTARRNYVNDSGPLHLASAMNAPVTSFFCSTIPAFGFGPLSDDSQICEVHQLSCRPCGMHGHPSCPKGHFRCGHDQLMAEVKQ